MHKYKESVMRKCMMYGHYKEMFYTNSTEEITVITS